MPGEYHEQLRLEKQVELIGVGPTSAAVGGWDGPAIEAEGKVESRVANRRSAAIARVGGGAMTGAVLVKHGAVLIVEECDISSEVGHCVVVQGVDTCGYVLHNAVRDAKGVGVLVCDHGKGVIEDNDILRNGRAGVAILSGGSPRSSARTRSTRGWTRCVAPARAAPRAAPPPRRAAPPR